MIAKQEVINMIRQLSETELEKVACYIRVIRKEKEDESVFNKEQQELLELLDHTVNTGRGDFAENHDKYLYGE